MVRRHLTRPVWTYDELLERKRVWQEAQEEKWRSHADIPRRHALETELDMLFRIVLTWAWDMLFHKTTGAQRVVLGAVVATSKARGVVQNRFRSLSHRSRNQGIALVEVRLWPCAWLQFANVRSELCAHKSPLLFLGMPKLNSSCMCGHVARISLPRRFLGHVSPWCNACFFHYGGR